jgi:hypothetical protein
MIGPTLRLRLGLGPGQVVGVTVISAVSRAWIARVASLYPAEKCVSRVEEALSHGELHVEETSSALSTATATTSTGVPSSTAKTIETKTTASAAETSIQPVRPLTLATTFLVYST